MDILIGWWKGENNALDSSGNGLNASWDDSISETYGTGNIGDAFSFNVPFGISSRWGLSVANNSLFNFISSDKFNISFWIKCNDLSLAHCQTMVIVKGHVTSGDVNWGIAVVAGAMQVYFAGLNFFTANTITDNSWHFFELIYDNGYVHSYLDGNSGSIDPNTQYSIINTAVPIFINDLYYGGFNGLIDEVKIYNLQGVPMVPTYQKLNLLLAKQQSALGAKKTDLVASDQVAVDDTFETAYEQEGAEQSLAQAIFGQPQTVRGMAKIPVKVVLPVIPTGSATEPTVSSWLKCCGMSYALLTKKHSYAPTSDIATYWKDNTVWSYTGDKTSGDSILTKAHSCMYDVEIAGEVGKLVMATFTGMGVPDGVPAAGTYPTDSVTAISSAVPAVLKNATQTINGLTVHVLKFAFKLGNDVQFIKDINDASGNLQTTIVGRKSSMTATIYQENASVNNPLTGMAAGTLATTTFEFGSAADSLISITSGSNKSEIVSCKPSVDNGLMCWDLELRFVDNSVTLAIND